MTVCTRVLVALAFVALSAAANAEELKPVTSLDDLAWMDGASTSDTKAAMPVPDLGVKPGDDLRIDVESSRPTKATIVTVVRFTAGGNTKGEVVQVVHRDAEAKAVKAWVFNADGSRASGPVLSDDDQNHFVFKFQGKLPDGTEGSFERHHFVNASTVQFKNIKVGGESMPNSPVMTYKPKPESK